MMSSHERKHWLGWLVVLVMALVNGAIRDATYGRALSRIWSHSLAVFPLSAGIAGWSLLLARRWPLPNRAVAARVGAVWLALTLAFEFGLGAMRGVGLAELLAAYDVTKGRLWPLVPVTMAVAPLLARAWRMRPVRR